MTEMDHKVCRPNRVYELRIENSLGSRVFASSSNYWEIRNEAKKQAGVLKRGENFVLVTSDGYELCRWM